MNTTRTPHSSSVEQGTRRRRVSRLFAAATTAFAVAAVTALGTGTAQAATWGGGQIVSSGVACNHGARTMDVSASTSQMYNYAAYVNGQWVRYRVFTRDVTRSTGAWVPSTGWSAWQWVNGTSAGGTFGTYDTTVRQSVDIGTTRLYGTAGHNYQASVQYDWWMGSDAIGSDPDMTFTESYSYFYFNPSRCVF